jgi:hypothetical protein
LQVTSLGVPGDFNDDGTVDAADFVVWRKRDGSQAGYDIWRANFGKILDVGGRSSTSSDTRTLSAAPEPGSAFICILAWAAATTIRRRHWFITGVPSTRLVVG